jgi:integrase
VRDRRIPASPCVDISLGSARPKAVSEVLTTEQVVALSRAMPTRYRALIIAAPARVSVPGLRPGELFGLATDRVDFLRRARSRQHPGLGDATRTSGRGRAVENTRSAARNG